MRIGFPAPERVGRLGVRRAGERQTGGGESECDVTSCHGGPPPQWRHHDTGFATGRAIIVAGPGEGAGPESLAPGFGAVRLAGTDCYTSIASARWASSS